MWRGIFDSTNMVGLEQTLAFTERRHQLLAGNIANMDTPDYKTRDLSTNDFQKSLADAITNIKSADSMHADENGSISAGLRSEMLAKKANSLEKVRDTMQEILYHDGSNDSLELQVTEIAKNQSLHGTATALIRSQFRTMQMAISESVNI